MRGLNTHLPSASGYAPVTLQEKPFGHAKPANPPQSLRPNTEKKRKAANNKITNIIINDFIS